MAKTTIIQTAEKNNYQQYILTPYHYTYVFYSDMAKTTIQETYAYIHDTVYQLNVKNPNLLYTDMAKATTTTTTTNNC